MARLDRGGAAMMPVAGRWAWRSWLALLAACGIAMTLARPVIEFDAVAIWYPKVRAFIAGAPLAEWPVAEYPPLGAVLWGLPLLVLGPGYEELGRSVFALVYVAWIATLPLLAPHSPFALPLAGALGLAMFDHQAVTSGYQDAFLMTVTGLAAVMLAVPGRERTGLLLAGALGLIKTEGTVYGALLALSWIVFRPARARELWRTVAVYGAIAAAWPAFLWWGRITGSALWLPDEVSLSLILERADRIPAIAERIAMLRPTYWLPVAAAACVSAAAVRELPDVRRTLAWLWSLAAGHLAFIMVAFMLTDAPLDWHLTTALSRLAWHHCWIWPVIIVLTLPRLIAAPPATTSTAVPRADASASHAT